MSGKRKGGRERANEKQNLSDYNPIPFLPSLLSSASASQCTYITNSLDQAKTINGGRHDKRK